MTLPRRLLKSVRTVNQFPVWKGPTKDGITQSMISTFLCCPERFRVRYLEGWAPSDSFNKHIEFGNMWHILEECLASPEHEGRNGEEELKEYCISLRKRFPLEQNEINKWYNVCIRQFRVYHEYWRKFNVREKSENPIPLFQEQTFRVPYELSAGRVVYLRGKFDSVFLKTKGSQKGLWLQENKTRSDINEEDVKKQLSFDLQTMFYLCALKQIFSEENFNWDDTCSPPPELTGNIPIPKGMKWPYKIAGVRYNVVRRPLSGGKGSIRQHQPTKSNPAGESTEEFYERLIRDYIKAEPDYWFSRWDTEITAKDIERFELQFLRPILETITDWHFQQSQYPPGAADDVRFAYPNHWRLPFGIYNPIAEGGTTDFEEYLNTGSTVGLVKTSVIFPELADA